MEIKVALRALSALAQESRLQIFRVLIAQGPEGLPAGRISSYLKVPPATLSYHLNELQHAQLIDCQRSGRQLIYFARYATISQLMNFLMENCCQGHPEACAFLQSAERTVDQPSS